MSTEERTRIAAELLGCNDKETPISVQVQNRLRAMNRHERSALSDRINGVLGFVEAYEAEEARIARAGKTTKGAT